MREMLLFMYTGRSPNLALMAMDLLAAADRFQLTGLKEMADQALRSNLSVENVCRSLVLADMHTSKELKSEAIRFIVTNTATVIQTEGWNSMISAHPKLVTLYEVMNLKLLRFYLPNTGHA